MSELLLQYGLFVAQTITIVVAIGAVITMLASAVSRGRDPQAKEHIEVKKLNERYQRMSDALNETLLDKKAIKQLHKEKSAKEKQAKKEHKVRKRLFVLDFDGDIKASAVTALREEITAILTVATPEDEVFVRLESGGGVVHGYGLAASQLLRFKQQQIPLTVAVDKIAASGGYMMAAVADRIIAAPFAIIGSIGVIAQLPNFHRLLKKIDIDYEQVTAGEFKRTLTLFGENTDTARGKFREQVEETHQLFKQFVSQHRPQVDIAKVATGEHWYASQTLDLHLVDVLQTSDDFLLNQNKEKDLYQVSYISKKGLGKRLSDYLQKTMRTGVRRDTGDNIQL